MLCKKCEACGKLSVYSAKECYWCSVDFKEDNPKLEISNGDGTGEEKDCARGGS
jgi:hypothetical protein